MAWISPNRGAQHLERKPSPTKTKEQAEIATRLVELHSDIEELKEREDELDELLEYCKSQMVLYSADAALSKYPFKISLVLCLKNISGSQTILGLQ